MDISRLEAPYEITSIDPWLAPHSGDIELRMNRFKEKRWQIAGDADTLTNFANGALYFGFHRTETGWVFREWMPGADEVHLIGDFNKWDRDSHPLDRGDNGVWEITLKGKNALKHAEIPVETGLTGCRLTARRSAWTRRPCAFARRSGRRRSLLSGRTTSS